MDVRDWLEREREAAYVPPPPPGARALPKDLPDHDGKTYDSGLDKSRLNSQQQDIFEAMRDGAWWTLSDLSASTGHPEASVSARIRDLRKPKFGGFTVESKRGPGRRGTWLYRLVV